tara:strand:- start:43 stop:546 length:504 start_codon:yes stop_codon:yes gene_type:complete
VNTEVKRYYLEINSFSELKETKLTTKDFQIFNVNPPDFQINKFFYKNVGKNHHWVDRLIWAESEWIKYVNDSKVDTYILKNLEDIFGYFELIHHKSNNEVEIAYLGLLEKYINKKLGSYLLSSAIKKSFLKNPNRVWVHTCSLDHKNALNNYLSRGMKVFKEEKIII